MYWAHLTNIGETQRRVAGAAVSAVLCVCSAPERAHAAPTTLCPGAPNGGSLVHGTRLQARPYLRLRHAQGANYWGHPLLLQLVNGAARAVAQQSPGTVALVGDLSAEHGGRLSGHASHQTGRDADVAYFMLDSAGNRANLGRFEAVDAQGRSQRTPGRVFDLVGNWTMLAYWLDNLRVPVRHIFVSRPVRQWLLAYAAQQPQLDRLYWLARKALRVAPNHGDHFHVRIACPLDQPKCLNDSRRR